MSQQPDEWAQDGQELGSFAGNVGGAVGGAALGEVIGGGPEVPRRTSWPPSWCRRER